VGLYQLSLTTRAKTQYSSDRANTTTPLIFINHIKRVYLYMSQPSENMTSKIATLSFEHSSTSHAHILYAFKLATPTCSKKENMTRLTFIACRGDVFKRPIVLPSPLLLLSLHPYRWLHKRKTKEFKVLQSGCSFIFQIMPHTSH